MENESGSIRLFGEVKISRFGFTYLKRDLNEDLTGNFSPDLGLELS